MGQSRGGGLRYKQVPHVKNRALWWAHLSQRKKVVGQAQVLKVRTASSIALTGLHGLRLCLTCRLPAKADQAESRISCGQGHP